MGWHFSNSQLSPKAFVYVKFKGSIDGWNVIMKYGDGYLGATELIMTKNGNTKKYIFDTRVEKKIRLVLYDELPKNDKFFLVENIDEDNIPDHVNALWVNKSVKKTLVLKREVRNN